MLRIVCLIGFIIFTALFINEVFIGPYRVNKSIEHTKELYDASNSITAPSATTAPANSEELPSSTEDIANAPNRDDKGRLLQFKELLSENEDVKGWITIPDSNIDYVVMQSGKEDPEYYLTRDMFGKSIKAGSLFLDYKSSVETPTQNMVIHGHNMTSSDDMFHYLIYYKELDYYKERPVFTFDTIYDTGKWKIFAVFITNGSSSKEPLFNYTKASFEDSSAFLNFVYQLRVRSMYDMDTVDLNENDQILTLSTCSYEVKNYRTVIVARKVREGEDASVDVDSISINPNPLQPETYYYRFGGEAPEIAATFEEALAEGKINWYTPIVK